MDCGQGPLSKNRHLMDARYGRLDREHANHSQLFVDGALDMHARLEFEPQIVNSVLRYTFPGA
jgi:hypothetical protein